MKRSMLALVLLLVTGGAEAQLDAGVPADAGPAPVADAVPPADPATDVEPVADPETATTTAMDTGTAPVTDAAAETDTELFLEEEPLFTGRLYGYIDAQYLHRLSGVHSDVHGEGAPVTEEHEPGFDVNLTVQVQGAIQQRYRYFLILAAPRVGSPSLDLSLLVRNAWVEVPLYQDYLQLRAGKTYRRFGLYNEILDATPTFVGIEAPEMLVQGHLLMTRTTNLMVHGNFGFDDHRFAWSLTTGQDERGEDGGIPIGADVHYDYTDEIRVGSSFYWTGGDAFPTRGVGGDMTLGPGPGFGGVKNWMERDEYFVFGLYAQLRLAGFILQLEYWRSPHEATRDRERVVTLSRTANFNARQAQRFFDGAAVPMESDVNVDADYTVQTFWGRLGYEIDLGDWGQLTPYLHADYYNDPEAIADETRGGNEAGLSDDGWFLRLAAGFVYRPIQPVAFKTEYNPHLQNVDGELNVGSELRFSLSYYWELE